MGRVFDLGAQAYEGRDHPPEMPLHIPEVGMNIEWPDDELYGIYQDDEWLSLFPRSNGWVALGPYDEMFVVSMFHQLHCIDALRYGYATAKAGVLVFPGNGTGVEHHVNHCLTYLKEIILCRGDTTLEESQLMRNPEGRMEHGASGVDMVHRCRDWTTIREYMEENFDQRVMKGIVHPNGTEIVKGLEY